MKKIFSMAAIVAISSLAIVSCKKEIKETNQKQETLPVVSSEMTTGFPIVNNPRPATDYLIDLLDADAEKINRQLYEMAIVGSPIFKNNTFNQHIINKARETNNSCVDLRSFVASTALRNATPEKAAFDNLRNLVNNADLTHKSKNPDQLEVVEDYIPAIFVANAARANHTKQPIISSGLYVNTELSGVGDFQDYIVVWFADNNGNFSQFLMSEATALTTDHPIFIFDNAEEEATLRPKISVNYATPPMGKNQSTAWYSSHEYQINHRYDNTSRSEFCITGAHITENGSVRLICRKSNGTFDTWKKIAEVHKNNVGQLRTQWEQFCSNEVLPFSQNFIFWNTYERDWAKSEKDLGQATRNGTTIYLYGRRHFSSEWYAYDPSQLTNNPVDLTTIYNSWAKWHDNSKGRFRIWRIQP